MAKRYALVRVDKIKHCPIYEGITGFCRNSGCDDCKMKENYGDTKEQLIRKVAQIIKRVTNDGYVVAYKKFGTGYINTALNTKDVAKEIVEFLGVEE